MLYKKIHRQYLRKWRIRRKFELIVSNEIHEVAKEPYINMKEGYISARSSRQLISMNLIYMTGPLKGILQYIDKIIWLKD